MSYIIGVDVGGTLIRAARFDQQLNMLQRTEQHSAPHEGSEAVISRIIETIRQVLPEDMGRCAGIGIAMPGPVDASTGTVLETPNLPFENLPIQAILEREIGGAVFVGNDADLAGLAEYELGAGKDARHMIYMTISTGVGGGLIIDGKPYTGAGIAGEIGHMVVLPDGPVCGCGKRGHIEALASGTAIARLARARLAAGEPSSLLELAGGSLEKVSARLVNQAAQEGDPLALSIITDAGRYLGIHIASLMMAFNPEMIVLGGGVTRVGSLLFKPMEAAIEEYCINPRYWERTPVVLAKLGSDVGLYGAGALVKALQK